MRSFLGDLRSAARSLWSARGFTVIAISTLATGVALCALVVTVVTAYVAHGLPYPAADRLYRVDFATPGQPPPRGLSQLDWASLDDVVECHIAWDLDVFYLQGERFPEAAPGAWVTPGYLAGYGVTPALGRTFNDDDFRAGSAAVALVSDRLWRTRFQSDPNVLGRSFRAFVSDRPDEPETFTIVGVLPADWWHLNAYTEVLAPLKAPTYPYMVRLPEGVSASIAAARITGLVRGGISALPADFTVAMTSTHESYVAAVRPLFSSVMWTAALVLLIAGANVSVLLLIRGRARQKELAVRVALGASHARIARLLALEGALIATAAVTSGVLVSRATVMRLAPTVEQFLERRVPGGSAVLAMDTPLVLTTSVVALIVVLIFTLAPLVAVLRPNLSRQLSGASRGTTDAPGASRTRAVLIGAEIAASLTLLTGAVLMAETALRMLQVNFGFQADRVVTVSLALRDRSFPDARARAAFYDRLSQRVTGVGQSGSVALGDWWPLQVSAPRRMSTHDANPVSAAASVQAVSGEYFSAMSIDLLDGRTFTPADGLGGEPVVIVSDALARRLWPNARAVGQVVTVHPANEGEPVTASVVGIAADVRQTHADTDLADAYLSLAQRPGRFAFIYLRAPGSSSWESELRSAIASIDREVAVGVPRWLETALDQERARPRFLAFMLTTFAIFACALALVGMYGVISYAARQRQREIAVRMAVGADRHSIVTMFLRHGVVVLIGGLAVGVAGSLGFGRVLQSQLFGVHPGELHVLVAAGLMFALCALAAIWWPAWRAASIDPLLFLKDE